MPMSTPLSTQVGMYTSSGRNGWPARPPGIPGARPTRGSNSAAKRMLTRLANTPSSNKTDETVSIAGRLPARESNITTGTATPRMISPQNTGARRPVRRMSSWSRWSGSPETKVVITSVNSRNTSAATNHSNSRRNPAYTDWPTRKLVTRSTTCPVTTTRAVPETSADEMNNGASSGVFQNGRATSSPKIQAVTECTRIATGKLTMAITRNAFRGTGTRVRIHRSMAPITR